MCISWILIKEFQHPVNSTVDFHSVFLWTDSTRLYLGNAILSPVPVAARSKVYAYGRSPAEILGSNPTEGMDICLLWVSCVVR